LIELGERLTQFRGPGTQSIVFVWSGILSTPTYTREMYLLTFTFALFRGITEVVLTLVFAFPSISVVLLREFDV
jgi:hypothetical protein